MELKDYLKSYRELHKISQRQFAEKCGLSNGYISMLERGYNPKTLEPITCSIGTLQKLASGMKITLETLLIDVDDMPVELLSADTCSDDASSVFKKSLAAELITLSGLEGCEEAEAEHKYLSDIAESNRTLSVKEMADIAERLGESLASMLGIDEINSKQPDLIEEAGQYAPMDIEIVNLILSLSPESKEKAISYLRFLAGNEGK